MSYGNDFLKSVYYSSPAYVKNIVSTVYGWKAKRERFGKYYHEYFKQIERDQWLKHEEMTEKQLGLLKSFLNHACRNSEYYRHTFNEIGFEPDRIKSLSDLKQIPILEKDLCRKNMDKIIAGNIKDVRWNHTSGTTGLALVFPESLECFEREYAFRFQNYSCGGIEVGQKWAFCAGHPVAIITRQNPPFWTYDYCNNWLLMSSYHMTERNLPLYINELEKFGPDLLGGYPSSIYLLALANEHCGKTVRPRAVYTASETLFDFQREAIQRSFDCKAYTYYGNAERAGFIAECPQGALHVKSDHSLIELINENGMHASPGEIGRLTCTAFGNYATPLIRYAVGDTAVLSRNQNCSCGRGGTLISELLGRVEDYILTPDGRFVGRLDHLFKDAINVRKAQIIQNSIDQVIIRIVKESDYSTDDEKAILKEAKARLGDGTNIEVEYVNDMERTNAGKHRFIISNLGHKKMFGMDLNSI